MTFVREDATARSAGVLLRHLSRIGAVLPRKLAAGEVATVTGSDVGHVSEVLTMTGPGVGAVIAYAVVAVVLWSFSPLLAAFVLLGVPAIVVLIGPLLRRLEQAESAYRHEQGILTDPRRGHRGGPAGARRGRRTRPLRAPVRRAVAEPARRGLPRRRGRQLDRGGDDRHTGPVPRGRGLARGADGRGRRHHDRRDGRRVRLRRHPGHSGLVPARGRLRADPRTGRGPPDHRPAQPSRRTSAGGPALEPAPAGPADLHDPATGLTVPDGRLLGVAAADPGGGRRAGRPARPVRRERRHLGRRAAGGHALDEVRARILVADHDSYLFAGTLRDILRVRDAHG